MIASIFHEGSGCGNQLFRYVMTRVIARDNGYEFGIIFPENFKGSSFMKLDMGMPVHDLLYEYNEKKKINNQMNDVRDYDWGLKQIKDFTCIDGEFQGENYYKHHLDEIRDWLSVEPLYMSYYTCVINFRGGEYVGVEDLFLPKEYWDLAIKTMLQLEPELRFEVHTDDPETAKKFFPDYPCIHDIGLNWRSIRYAKYLILSNSSFSILPALLGDAKLIIAPKFHAGYNKGYWQLEQNRYEKFTYIHHEE